MDDYQEDPKNKYHSSYNQSSDALHCEKTLALERGGEIAGEEFKCVQRHDIQQVAAVVFHCIPAHESSGNLLQPNLALCVFEVMSK